MIAVSFLESLLQLDVTEPTFDRGKRFVVAVLKGGGYEWRIFVEHVLHPKRERRVIKPAGPATGVVLSSGDGNHIFLLASFAFTFLPPSLAKPGTSAGEGGGKLNVYDAIRASTAVSNYKPLAGSFWRRSNEFLESRIGAQRVPDRIEPQKRWRNGHWVVKPTAIWHL